MTLFFVYISLKIPCTVFASDKVDLLRSGQRSVGGIQMDAVDFVVKLSNMTPQI